MERGKNLQGSEETHNCQIPGATGWSGQQKMRPDFIVLPKHGATEHRQFLLYMTTCLLYLFYFHNGKANSLQICGSILFSNYKDHQGNIYTYTITSVVLRIHNIVHKFRTFFLGTRKLLTPIMMVTYQTNRTLRSTVQYSYTILS